MTKSSDDVESLLDSLQEDLNKAFGDNSVMRLDSQETLSRVDHWVSTRSIVVDSVLRGGRPIGASLVPFGRQMEISGVESSGKSTLCAHIAAEIQSKGGIVIVTDTEERIDHEYWGKLDVDVGKLLRIQASSVDDVFNKQYEALRVLQKKAPERLVLMLWDSLGGTRPLNLIDEKAKESPMEQAEKFAMRQAKVISQGMELINGIVAQTRACYLYTNHEYTKMGVTYGSARETRGGNKPKYFATVRIQLTPVGAIYEEDAVTGQKQVIGHKIQVKALKNSMAGILMTREAVVMANKGFVNEYTVFDIASKLGLIKKSGSWSKYTGSDGKEYSFQGFNGFVDVVVPTTGYQLLFNEVVLKM